MSILLRHNLSHLRKNLIHQHYNVCNRKPLLLARRRGGYRFMCSNSTPPVPKKSMFRRVLRTGLKTLGGVVFVVACGVAGYAQVSPGFARLLDFWTVGFPTFLVYKMTDVWHENSPVEEREKVFNKLHEWFSPVVRDQVLRMGGFFQKHAQFCSNMVDFFPDVYLEWMRELQDKAACPISNEEAKRIVEDSLGRPLHEVFLEWEDEPIGAASIGQCYKAKLLDGTVVAVKVQSPGVEEKFRLDISTSRQFCELAMPQHTPALDEIEKQFATEFDYIGEANNLNDISKNLQETWGDRVYIPKPYMELCTKDVLVMDFCTGTKFVDRIRGFYRQYAKKTGVTLEELEAEMQKKMRDPKYVWSTLDDKTKETQTLYWLTIGEDVYNNLFKLCYNYSLGWIFRPYNIQWSILPVDLGETLALILDVHAHQILIDGCFNGDPHPGNLLICDDGRLGLIDFGQVKRWTPEYRILFSKIMLAFQADDKDEIVRLLVDEMGYRTKYMKPDILHILACFYFDRFDPSWPGGTNLQKFTELMEELDPVVNLNDEFIMAGRCVLMLRFLGKAFGVQIRISNSFAPFARQCLREHSIEYKHL